MVCVSGVRKWCVQVVFVSGVCALCLQLGLIRGVVSGVSAW